MGYQDMPLPQQLLLVEQELRNIDPLRSRALLWDRALVELRQASRSLRTAVADLDRDWTDGVGDSFAGHADTSRSRLEGRAAVIDRHRPQARIDEVAGSIRPTYDLVRTNLEKARALEASLNRQANSLDPPGPAAYVMVENQVRQLQVQAGAQLDELARRYRVAWEAVRATTDGPDWSGLPSGAGVTPGAAAAPAGGGTGTAAGGSPVLTGAGAATLPPGGADPVGPAPPAGAMPGAATVPAGAALAGGAGSAAPA
ncbi:hypothetical protein ACFHW0_25900, partial [Micromonospora sp. LOL_025]